MSEMTMSRRGFQIIKRRRLLASVCLVSALLASAFGAAAPPEPLRLAADEWPPFTDVEGKPRRAIALVEAGLRRGNLRTSFGILKWTSLMSLLGRGNFDGVAAIWKTPEREKSLLYSKPYFQNRLVLVARAGDDASATSIAQLPEGKRLALTNGYGYSPSVTGASNVKLIHYDTDADCLRAVLAKQADYLLLDELVVRHLFKRYPEKAPKLIVVGQTALDQHPLHLALRKDYPNAANILADFDRNMSKMMADGTYNVLLDLPWIGVDTDQDGELEYIASSRSAAQADGDPNARHNDYPVFNSGAHAPNTGRAPEYVIDGKSYNSWGEAASTLQRDTTAAGSDLYKYSTGFVLGQF
jgi:polar amino acid transport system substrate-binding protein